MEEKPFYEIETISRDVLHEVVRQNGRVPDNFVDSSEGNFMVPDVDQDPAARSLASKIDHAIDALIEQAAAEH